MCKTEMADVVVGHSRNPYRDGYWVLPGSQFSSCKLVIVQENLQAALVVGSFLVLSIEAADGVVECTRRVL